MGNPLYFCLGSLGQFAADGLGGPIIAIGAALNMVLDICEADTEYQTVTARQDEREKSLKQQKKMAADFAQVVQEGNEMQLKLVEMIHRLAKELEKERNKNNEE